MILEKHVRVYLSKTCDSSSVLAAGRPSLLFLPLESGLDSIYGSTLCELRFRGTPCSQQQLLLYRLSHTGPPLSIRSVMRHKFVLYLHRCDFQLSANRILCWLQRRTRIWGAAKFSFAFLAFLAGHLTCLSPSDILGLGLKRCVTGKSFLQIGERP